MKDQGGYPVHRMATNANRYTPVVNRVTGKYPAKGPVFITKGKPKWSPKPGYKPSDGRGVGH